MTGEDIAGVDILCGGCPCQSFSTAGNGRGIGDARGNLLYSFGRLAAESQSPPRIIIVENVLGLLSKPHKVAVAMLYSQLEGLGYAVDHRAINADRYVPQSRKRVFFVAIRDPVAPLQWPEPPSPGPIPLSSILQVSEDAGEAEISPQTWQSIGKHNRDDGSNPCYRVLNPDRPAWTLPRHQAKKLLLPHPEVCDVELSAEQWAKLQERDRIKAPLKLSGSAKPYRDLNEDSPTPTLTRSQSSKLLLHSAGLDRPRVLTTRERCRCFGLPEDYSFASVTRNQAWEILGNGVVVPVVAAVARAALASAGILPEKSKNPCNSPELPQKSGAAA